MGYYDDETINLKKQLAAQYVVVVIDPATGNQSDFTFKLDTPWCGSLELAAGDMCIKAMKRLSARAGNPEALK